MDISFLQKEREAVIDEWFDLIVATYPGLSSIFLKKDHAFGNPVGMNIKAAIGQIFDILLKPEPDTELTNVLDTVIRIRAVQNYSPSQAVGILLLVKEVVRKRFIPATTAGKLALTDFLEFESRVDKVVQVAFDIYTKCRDQLFELRLKDSKIHISGLLRKLNLKENALNDGFVIKEPK